jgi:hypothetical protein
MVPVRDSSFIGKKIDCPKCKYRFVVEEPEVEEDERDEAPARGGRDGKKGVNGKATLAKKSKGRRDDEDGAPGKKKKKTGPSTTLIVGVGVGAVAVVVLVIVGLWMGGVIGGDDDQKTTSTTTNSQPANTNPTKKPDDKPAGAAAPAFAGKDPTNLLLSDSTLVLRLNLSAATGSGVSRAAFESPGSFSPTAFKQHFGFGVGEVETALRAVNFQNATHFNIIRTKNDIRRDDISQRLGLKPEEPVNGMDYFTITADLDSFGNFLFQEEPRNRKDRLSPLALHFADERTLVIAHLPAMKSFLDYKGTPPNLTQPPPPSQGGNRGGPPGGGMMGGGPGMMGGGPGMAGGGPGMAGGGPGMAGGGPPGGGMMGGPGQGGGAPPGGGGPPAGGGGPPGGGRGGRGGPDQAGPPAGGAGGQQGGGQGGGGKIGGPGGEDGPGAGRGGPPGGMGMMGGPGGGMMGGPGGGMMGGNQNTVPVSGSWLTVKPHVKSVLDAVEFAKEPTILSMGLDKETYRGAGVFKKDSLIDLLPDPIDFKFADAQGNILPLETSALGLAIHVLRPNRLTMVFGAQIKDGETKFVASQQSMDAVALGIAMRLKVLYGLDVQVGGNRGGGGGRPGAGGAGMMGGGPGMMGGGPGMMGGGPGMMGGGPGMMGQQGGAGGGQPPGGGAGPPAGMMGGPGMMGGGPGMMGGGPGMMGGGPGMMGGGPGMRGGGPGAGGQPGRGGQQQQQDQSTVSLTQSNNTIITRVDVIITDEVYDKIKADLQKKLSVIKGEAEMIGAKSKVHELAAALKQLVQKRGKFPMGARERKAGPDRLGLAYPPDQRISWLAELLPYLGSGEYSELYDAIAWEKSWRDADNQVVASSLVSHFLNPWSSRPAWWVPYSHVGAPVAATHFVGIAGLGLDAAEFSKENKAVADKIGIFHYDWQTELKDIKKPEATIAMLQVPFDDFKTPWLAGGGSSVRGVAEETGIEAFVCESYTYKDGSVKAGTFAIMANGDVRFIPRDIPKDMFLKMCSLNLADKIDNLDDYAPLVPPPKVAPKPVLPPVTPEKKSGPEIRNPEPPKKPAAANANSKGLTALSTHCAQCHTGARAKGKNMMFNDDGSLNPNLSKEAISKALADGKMPPKGRPRPPQDDLTAIQDWLKGG